MTQNNLGDVLTTLGEREDGTDQLEQAVKAYRSALEERTRERVPLDWASTQNNLGNALARLGERESGTARLEDAVKAYRSALEELTRERVPLQWAETQNNLGAALQALGERESGTTRLEGGDQGLSRGARGKDAAIGFRSIGRERKAISVPFFRLSGNARAMWRGSRRRLRPTNWPSRS